MWGEVRGSSVGGVVSVVLWNMVLPEKDSQELSAHFGVSLYGPGCVAGRCSGVALSLPV